MGSQTSTLTPPPGYVVPSFPSLYNPKEDFENRTPLSLYSSKDVYRFTLYWTLILYASTYALCGTWAMVVRLRNIKQYGLWVLAFPIAFTLTGTFFAVIGSAIIGYVLAAVYSVGSFRVSTWVPFLWAMIQTLLAIMGSYSTIITML